jgi:hypothetical protein
VSRQNTIPSGTSRATLFALGLTLAGQACGGERVEKKDDSYGYIVPPYGAMPFGETCDNPLLVGCGGSSGAEGPAGSGGGTSGAGGSGAGGSGAGGSGAGGSGGTDSVGGNAGSGGAAADAGTSDAGLTLDAGAEDAGGDAAPDDAGT